MKFKKHIKKLEGILSSETIPEISIKYKVRTTLKKELNGAKERSKYIRKLFDKNDFDLRERFVVLMLDINDSSLGYFTHTIGEKYSAPVDIRLIFQKLFLLGCDRFIVAHNHPPGVALPSEPDTEFTKTLEHQAQFVGLTLVDHIILTRKRYYSYEEQGFL